jgi:hypothetical protein
VKVAVTVRAAPIVSWQAPVPRQPPLQPEKVEPDSGVAVKDTTVPALRLALHEVPQLMLPSPDTTVPAPVPVLATISVKLLTCTVNVADTLCAALIVT